MHVLVGLGPYQNPYKPNPFEAAKTQAQAPNRHYKQQRELVYGRNRKPVTFLIRAGIFKHTWRAQSDSGHSLLFWCEGVGLVAGCWALGDFGV